MSEKNNQPTIQVRLTPAQQERVQQLTGKQIVALKLEALEERAVPALCPN